MSIKNNKLKIGISIGDPNGIGVEVILKTLQNKDILEFFTPIIFASTKLMSYQKNIFGLNSMYFQGIFKPEEAIHGKINVVNLWKDNVTTDFGKLTDKGTQIAISSLEAAMEALEKGSIDIMVTAPTNNEAMQNEGFEFPNHIKYFENKLKSTALMLLENNNLRIAMATHDIPLEEVSNNLSKELVKKQIKSLNTTLVQDFWIERPKIAVLGLNPHIGEEGSLGKEEIEIIEPAIRESHNRGILAFGPYSMDSFFDSSSYCSFDGILTMYHDQGLIPFQNLTSENGVNFASGLPYIITAPDHGTEYSIAGQNLAHSGSFQQAIYDAIKIYKNRKEQFKLIADSLRKSKIEGIDTTIDEDLPVEGEN